MALTAAEKAEVIKQHQLSENDTGSVEVQVSLITKRIQYLTEHSKKHKKDLHTRRGLQHLVNQRRKLLRYLKRTAVDRYKALIQTLGLRDSY